MVAYLASAIRPDFCCIDNGHSSACGDKVDPSIYVTCYVGPNISGKAFFKVGDASVIRTYSDEAFQTEGTALNCFAAGGTPGSLGESLSLSASRSSSIYSGSKLQPSALQLLACIRA